MGSPTIFSGRRTKALTADGFLLSNNSKIDFDGAKNYILNGHAEVNTLGWQVYADAAQSTPVDGISGAPNVTWTRTTTTPIAGSGSFLFAKDAVNRIGQGASCDFSIDRADRFQVLRGQLSYEVVSGTFASGDLEIFVYDVTNAVLVPCTPSKIQNSTIGERFSFEFQATSSQSYRLIIHCASASAVAYSLEFDEISVGPQPRAFGSQVQYLGSYVPTVGAGFGTVTANTAHAWRMGDKLLVQGSFTTGTVAASIGSISLFSGLSLDASKLSITNNNTAAVGSRVGTWHADTANQSGNIITAPSSSTSLVYFSMGFSGTNPLVPSSAISTNAVSTNADPVAYNFEVPIAGWASSSASSTDTDTRIVAAHASNASGVALNTAVPYSSVGLDTHAGFSGGRYTIQVAGIYAVNMAAYSAAASVFYYVALNGTKLQDIAITDSNGACQGSFVIRQALTAGDIIDIRSDAATGTNTRNYFSIQRLSGPAQVLASEKILASYYMAATKTPSTGQLDFDTKITDTHLATQTGVSWRFTAPSNGSYCLQAFLAVNTASTTWLQLFKNGTAHKNLTAFRTSSEQSVSNTIDLIAGDFIDLRFTVAPTNVSGGALNATGTSNFSIFRIGL